MTDTKDICEAIKGLPDDALVYVDAGGIHNRMFKAKTLKALVAENEALRQKLNCIAFYAKDHDEPKSHCALCLIEAIINGQISPLDTADGGNDE